MRCPANGEFMLSVEDKQILLDCAGTIESGLMRIADAIPTNDIAEVAEAIRYAGERIERGLCLISSSLDRHLPE